MIQRELQIKRSVTPERQNEWWSKLHWVALIGGLMRIAAVFIYDRIHQPDEIFQYLEQAHRLEFGYGIIPWEYRHGIRSWILPGFLAGLLNILHRLQLDDPSFYVPAIKIFFSVISVSLIYASYLVVRTLASEHAARITSVIVSFWYELIHFAGKPTPEILGAYCLTLACALVVVKSSRKNTILVGLLCGLGIILRVQYLPVIAVLALGAVIRWTKREVAIAASIILMLLGIAGYVDYLTWGTFFASYYNNYLYNSVYRINELFGVEPFTDYFRYLIVNSGGLFLIAVINALRPKNIGKTWFMLLLIASVVLPHSLIAHKETRFVFFAIPFVLMLIAIALSDWTWPTPAGVGKLAKKRWLYVSLSLIFGFSSVGMLAKIRFRDPFYQPQQGTIMRRLPNLSAYLFLHQQADLVAVLNDYSLWPGTELSDSGGYYYLHRNVPIYYGEQFAKLIPKNEYANYVSHIICPEDNVTPGFVTIAKFASVEVRRVIKPPAQWRKLAIDTINMPQPGVDGVHQPRVQTWPR
jgi:GPI mannosyltransferase 3